MERLHSTAMEKASTTSDQPVGGSARDTLLFRVDDAHPSHELWGLVSKDDPTPLFEWLRARPELRPIVLSAANAVGHPLRRRIDSLEHAVVYLGQRGMEQLVDRLLTASESNTGSRSSGQSSNSVSARDQAENADHRRVA